MVDRRGLDTDFLFRRAEEEAIFAIRTHHPKAEAAHFDLSLRYGERARAALADGADPFLIVDRPEPQQE